MTEASIHFQQNDSCTDVINQSPNTHWVFQVDPPTATAFPGKTVVGRKYVKNEGDYIAQGAAGADQWWADFGPYVDARPYIKIWVACNEPQGDWVRIAEYQRRWANLCRARGLRAVVGNFSIGTPEPEHAPVFKEMVAAGDYLAFHEYWMPRHWRELDKWQGWVMWRYKKFMANLPSYLQQTPVLITECGCDGGTKETYNEPPDRNGWREHYSDNEDAYLSHCKQYLDGINDDRVKALFLYTAGPYSDWETFRVTESLAKRWTGLNTASEPVPTPVPDGPTVRVKKPDGTIAVMNIEEYVRGVVPKEVPTWWPIETLRAQAIAARSYALATKAEGKHHDEGYDLCSTTCCQVYSDDRYVKTNQAVEDTHGIVGVHNGNIAHTFFSASCGGTTLGNWASYLRYRTDCPCGLNGHEKWGHQNGMCQWGAYYLALEEKNWLEILDFYYDLLWVQDYGLGDAINPPSEPPVNDEALAQLEAVVTDLSQRLAAVEVKLGGLDYLNVDLMIRKG